MQGHSEHEARQGAQLQDPPRRVLGQGDPRQDHVYTRVALQGNFPRGHRDDLAFHHGPRGGYYAGEGNCLKSFLSCSKGPAQKTVLPANNFEHRGPRDPAGMLHRNPRTGQNFATPGLGMARTGMNNGFGDQVMPGGQGNYPDAGIVGGDLGQGGVGPEGWSDGAVAGGGCYNNKDFGPAALQPQGCDLLPPADAFDRAPIGENAGSFAGAMDRAGSSFVSG